MAIDVEYKISSTKTKITVQVDNLEVIEAFTAGKDKVLIIRDLLDDMAPLPEAKEIKREPSTQNKEEASPGTLKQPSGKIKRVKKEKIIRDIEEITS